MRRRSLTALLVLTVACAGGTGAGLVGAPVANGPEPWAFESARVAASEAASDAPRASGEADDEDEADERPTASASASFAWSPRPPTSGSSAWYSGRIAILRAASASASARPAPRGSASARWRQRAFPSSSP